MYFLRLAKLKPAVEELALDAWDGMEVGFITLRRPEYLPLIRETDR